MNRKEMELKRIRFKCEQIKKAESYTRLSLLVEVILLLDNFHFFD